MFSVCNCSLERRQKGWFNFPICFLNSSDFGGFEQREKYAQSNTRLIEVCPQLRLQSSHYPEIAAVFLCLFVQSKWLFVLRGALTGC